MFFYILKKKKKKYNRVNNKGLQAKKNVILRVILAVIVILAE